MFDIPLLGEGTGSVEALPSYLHRCAFHHGVSTSKFLDYLHQQIIKIPDFSISYKQRQYYSIGNKPSQLLMLSSLVTANLYTIEYIEIIKILTGRDLTDATFYKLQSIITRPNNEIVRCLRWCPECFVELRKQKAEPYIKLIWFLRDITHCNIHRTRLLDVCPHCGTNQNAMGRKVALDICNICKGDLKERIAPIMSDIMPSWIHQGEDLTRLISKIIHDKTNIHELFGFSSITRNITPINPYVWRIDKYSGGLTKSIKDFTVRCTDPEFDEVYKVCWTNKDIRKQIFYENNMSLNTLRIFSFLSDTDIYDVITGNLVNKSIKLPFLWKQEFPMELKKSKKRKLHNHNINLEKIAQLMEGNTPLSFKEVSRRSGLSSGYIAYRFPGLKQEIVSRYKIYIDRINMDKHQKAICEAVRYFNSSKYPKSKKSMKQALKKLMEETSLSKDYLKPAIKEAFKSYYKKMSS